MKLDDQTLSAFLDAELPAEEMEQIRQQLSEDDELCSRLASLASVDAQLKQHYSEIDARPLPEGVGALLQQNPKASEKPANLIRFPFWKQAQRHLQKHAAVAAALALALGFGLGHMDTLKPDNSWHAVSAALNSASSGERVTIAESQEIKPRLTFKNQQGLYCRQFQLVDERGNSENIACRSKAQWQLVARVQSSFIANSDAPYQTATGGSLLDSALDSMMQDQPLDFDSEQRLLLNGWQQ